MARIELAEGVTLKGARRMLTKNGGSFRITRRFGKLYTMVATVGKQPNTERQMECREMLKRANVMAREDLAKPGRREYWEEKAKEMGYKTAVGCARAWYIREIKNGKNYRSIGNWENCERKMELDGGEKIERRSEDRKDVRVCKSRRNRGSGKEIVVIGRRWKRGACLVGNEMEMAGGG